MHLALPGGAIGERVPTGEPVGTPRRVRVAALGRLEPKDGVINIAGPSRPAVVIASLLVHEGEHVEAGQAIAVLDSLAEDAPRVTRLRAELDNATAELDRYERLHREGVASASLRDAFRLKVDVARAELLAAEAALERARVRAPVRGQILKIRARSGERVGLQGIAELGQTDEMQAMAQVYETDIGKVRVGQRAVVTSPALPEELHGTVDQIGLQVGQLDALSTDPAAITDARVVEVKIRLDDARRVAGLTHLQVEVAIDCS